MEIAAVLLGAWKQKTNKNYKTIKVMHLDIYEPAYFKLVKIIDSTEVYAW